MTSKEKQDFANEAEKALLHPIFESCRQEALLNMQQSGVPKELLNYIVTKIGTYAAQIARAQALGIDPVQLRNTPEEAGEELLKIAKMVPEKTIIIQS